MRDLQRRLSERFSVLRDSRRGPVFFIEHGLGVDERAELQSALRTCLRTYPLDTSWWDGCDLPLLVASTEVGYRYRGSGTDFWPLLEDEFGIELSPLGRQRIKNLFVRASGVFRGARPPATAWSEAFHLITWPISHSLLPLEFHRPLAAALARLRVSVIDAEDDALYRALRIAAALPTARFATLLEDASLVVSLTRSLLRREAGDFSFEVIERLFCDLEADDMARRGVAVARSIQRAQSRGGLKPLPAATPTKGTLQLRMANDALLLEACFPALNQEVAGPLRRTLRRHRFATRLWGATARVPSDQLLSGLPFPVKLTSFPPKAALLFTDLDTGEFDAQDLAILHSFELELSFPLLFAVSVDGDVGRQVFGSTITGHRKYWALLGEQDRAPQGVRTLGDVGPLRCIELDPSSAAGARALAQFGYDVRLGVSVRFAGTPPIDRGTEIPTFVAGDSRVLVPQRLTGEAALEIEVNGSSAIARSSDVVRFAVQSGDQRLKVSSETDLREYAFRGVDAPPVVNAPVSLELRSEERTVQALLGGRLSFVVDGRAPIDGLNLTVDLDVRGHVFSVTGPLGPVPQPVSIEHPVMKVLLSEDVQDHVSVADVATLRVRVGHLAHAAWELGRFVRPCWWDLRSVPTLLSEEGPLKFGTINASEAVRPPTEGLPGNGTYLLAPVALDRVEFSAAAPFATLCIAPSRADLHPPAIERPRIERRRRGSGTGVGLEELAEAYLRWSLAETCNAIGELHRRQVAARLEQWITELCCGAEWTEKETTLTRNGLWSLLEQVCKEEGLGRDAYLELSSDQDAQVRRLAMDEIRRSIPALWSRVAPPSDLDDHDYETLDAAFATAYEMLASRYRARGQARIADELARADPARSPNHWADALLRVRLEAELPAVAAMLLPSSGATRLMALDVGAMSVEDVADELVLWAASATKAFAGAVPSRDVLKVSYGLWVEPEMVLSANWRAALDTLLCERSVARATRYLALRLRQARTGEV